MKKLNTCLIMSKTEIKTTQEHLKKLFYFLMRPGMYIGSNTDKELFITFLFGFRHGSNTLFFNEFENYIEKKYQIAVKGRSFVGQIETLSQINKQDWISNFSKESFEMIFKLADEKQTIEFNNAVRKRIFYLLKQETFNANLKRHWNILVTTNAQWFTAIFTAKELEIILAKDKNIN